jgi:hypothetical protein
MGLGKFGRVRVIGPATPIIPAPGPLLATATSPAGDMSANIVGAAMMVLGKTKASFETAWPATGSPVGQFTFEWSNEYDPITNPGATFTTFTQTSADLLLQAPASIAGRFGVLLDVAVAWIRPRYVRGSGGAGAAVTCTGVAASN